MALTVGDRPIRPLTVQDVRVQLPLRVPDATSLPEPDVAVVARDDLTISHPRTALLVIEVAESSLPVDTTVKPALYAAAGVPDGVLGRRRPGPPARGLHRAARRRLRAPCGARAAGVGPAGLGLRRAARAPRAPRGRLSVS